MRQVVAIIDDQTDDGCFSLSRRRGRRAYGPRVCNFAQTPLGSRAHPLPCIVSGESGESCAIVNATAIMRRGVC
jgi:hypothetical protein